MPTEPTFDAAAALARLGGDADVLRQIAEIFLRQHTAHHDAIQRAFQTGDAEALARSAHALKGAVANFDAHAVHAAAANLEAIGRRGDLERAPDAARSLAAALDTLVRDLAGYVDKA